MTIPPRQFRDMLILGVGLLFLLAGVRVITQYMGQRSGPDTRVYVQAAPFVETFNSGNPVELYRLLLRRCKVDAVLVQMPATLSPDLVENLGAPALMERYAGTLDTLALTLAGLQQEFNFTYVPFNGWRLRMIRSRDRFFNRLSTDETLQSLVDNYRTDHLEPAQALAPLLEEDGLFGLNSKEADAIFRRDNTRFTRLFSEVFAVEGGYVPMNEAYESWIEDEISRHPRRPILILYDATQAWLLAENLAKLEHVRVQRPFRRLGFSLFGRWKYLLTR